MTGLNVFTPGYSSGIRGTGLNVFTPGYSSGIMGTGLNVFTPGYSSGIMGTGLNVFTPGYSLGIRGTRLNVFTPGYSSGIMGTGINVFTSDYSAGKGGYINFILVAFMFPFIYVIHLNNCAKLCIYKCQFSINNKENFHTKAFWGSLYFLHFYWRQTRYSEIIILNSLSWYDIYLF